jgi:glycosyltransferase involved in cell wall biosynthesis
MSKITAKNITIFLPRLHNNMRPLINGLLENNYKVSVLVMRSGQIEDHSKINYTKAKRYSFMCKKLKNIDEIRRFEFISLFDVIKYFKKNKPEYLLIRNDTTLAFLTVLMIGKIRKCRIIFYNQYPYFDNHITRNIYNSFFYKILRIPSITPVLNENLDLKNIVKNETLTEYKKRLFNLLQNTPSSTGKIWFPFGIEKLPSNKPNIKKINILTVGKFEKRKNLDLVIDCVSKISKNKKQLFELTIAGELEPKHTDYFNYINYLSSNSGTKNLKIQVLCNLSRPKMMNLYRNSHYFFLLSEKEICSVSQVEAFIHNCKLVINCDNGNLDFLPVHKNYFLVTDLEQFIANPGQIKLDNRVVNMNNYIYEYNKVFGINSQAKRLDFLFQTTQF